MSNPFAVLSVNEDSPSRRNQKNQNKPKLTPAERAVRKQERERKKREETELTTSSFVVHDDDLSGFIEVEDRRTNKDKEEKLSKEEFISKRNRGEIVSNNRNRQNKGKNQNRNQNRGNNQNRGRNNNNRNQNRNQNRGNNQNRGRNNKQGGGKNQGGNKQQSNAPTQWVDRNSKKEGGKTYVQKKDRKSRNPMKTNTKGGGWKDRVDENFEQSVLEAKDIVPEEGDESSSIEMESSEEWFHEEIPEDSDKTVVNPNVKREGLSAYLAKKEEEEKRALELSEKLTANVRSLDVVIDADSNLNKKNSSAVDDRDQFLFGQRQNQKKKTNKKTTQNTGSNVEVQFRMKRHRGYNMPRERKPEGEQKGEGSPNQNRNQGKRNNRNQGGNGGRGRGPRKYNNNRPRKNPRFNEKSFPPLGGTVLPKKPAVWLPEQQEE